MAEVITKTIKVSKEQEQALIWAFNIFRSTSEGLDDPELEAEYDEALTALAPIYDLLEDYN